MLGPCSSPTYFWLLLLIHVFFDRILPLPLLHEKKERIVKIVNFEVIEYDEQLSFFLSLVF